MDPTLPVRPSPRYIALLVGAAFLVLLIGAILRPRAKEAVTVVPTNELATLPELTQRRALRDMASYVAQRVSDVGGSVIYLPELQTSGLVLGQDSVLTALAERPAGGADGATRVRLLVASLPTGTARPVAAQADVDTSPRWRLVVARSPDGRNLALTGLTGGMIEARCGDLTLRHMIFDAVVPPALAGGGIFNLEGNAIGLVVPCGNHEALVPIREVSRMLALQQSPEFQLWTRYGLRAEPADSVTGPLPVVGAGLLATEVELGSPAYRAGIRAGDLITRINREPAAQLEDLTPLLADSGAKSLVVQRTPRGLALSVAPPARSNQPVRPATSSGGLALTTVEPQSRAARAGLEKGDRIIQVGRSRTPTAALLERALSDTTPVFLVYERDGRQRAVVLR